MSSSWDERYKNKEFVFGTDPNEFFADTLKNIKPGRILLPCEGEGRNAVYAAKKGWMVEAFDLSIEGKKKAELLALENDVQIHFQVADAVKVEFVPETFDVIALIYAHFPPEIRTFVHQNMIEWLKPGGMLLMEAFNPEQLGNNSGGPKDPDMLYTEEILKIDFDGLKIIMLEKAKITLNEGSRHKGLADVIRFIGVKQ